MGVNIEYKHWLYEHWRATLLTDEMDEINFIWRRIYTTRVNLRLKVNL